MKQTKGLQALGIAFFGSLAGAALGTPFVYKTVRYLALENPCCLWIYLAGKPIDTYFDRLRWLIIIAGIPWIIRKVGNVTPISCQRDFVQRLFHGYLNGMGLGLFLAGLCGLHLKFVLRSPTPLLKTILTAAISSVLIATVEELLFRGLLLKALMNVWNTSISVVTGSLLFALLHFTSPINFPPSASVAWYDGWRLALHSFTSIVPNLQWPYFLNLVMLGSWLGLKTLREGHLGGCIGLHGGLVFILLVLRRTVEVTASDPSGWFGKGRLTDSFLSCIVLGIVTVFTWARSPVSRGKQPSLSEIH